MENTLSPAISEFIDRWQKSGAAERANYQHFLVELCDVVGVARPDPTRPNDQHNTYVFERAVTFQNPDGTTSPGRIDLYKRGCFVLEAKQGSEKNESGEGKGNEAALKLFAELPQKKKKGTAVRGTKSWDDAMLKARGQAEQYAKALPMSEGWPVFLVVVDIGHSFELYADFTRGGKTYLPFPDAQSHRLKLFDLSKEEIQERLRLIWTDPLLLDPSRQSTRITREVAAKLAAVAKSLEESGQKPEIVAAFLMRCLFTMFAEDVELIPKGKFTELLKGRLEKLHTFKPMLEALWKTMNTGGFSEFLEEQVLRFNGGLFESNEALPVSRRQLELLIEASESEWQEVEPAIFGTLLERALDPVERHKLGAHYTPRAYVERLVLPTIIEPLREQWKNVQAAAVLLAKEGKLKEAAAEIQSFHRQLCEVRVLDPACGSGNFLYVTLEHLKRLEGEVINALNDFDSRQAAFEIEGFTVDPHQLLGLEVNPRAASIADIVLWIGYLQWHFRTRGDAKPSEPVLRKFRNIENRDAVLDYDRVEVVTDSNGQPVTQWDGRTLKKHPVTGENVPDEAARVPLHVYINSRKAAWPVADYVVGNPPFIGNKRMRAALGDGYTEALRSVYAEVPDTIDFVMYWWEKAAQLASAGKIKRFGFITTNSITQIFNRRVIQNHLAEKKPLSLLFAIPDHPWVDAIEGAAVRISMTVAAVGEHEGMLQKVEKELVKNSSIQNQDVSQSAPQQNQNLAEIGHIKTFDQTDSVAVELSMQRGKIFADLTIGADTTSIVELAANTKLSGQGVIVLGEGFILTEEDARKLIALEPMASRFIKKYRNGKDITQISRNLQIIDLFGIDSESTLKKFPHIYQRIYDLVRPARLQMKDKARREKWWLFGRSNKEIRSAINGLQRYIATCRTAKHRVFIFLDGEILPDAKIVAIGLEDAFYLAVLSSRFHVQFAISTGGWLGVGNDSNYNHADCFNKFPFPQCAPKQKEKIQTIGERLDAHRKHQQTLHPALTITDMYNVLEKLRVADPLNEKDKRIHDDGLVSVLNQLHQELDVAVAEAYGWPVDLPNEEILLRLVALNDTRAREEQAGHIRWLRPEYQRPAGVQTMLDTGDSNETVPTTPTKISRLTWPKTLPEQAAAIRVALAAQTGVVTAEKLAKNFSRARTETVANLLQTLVSLGLAREVKAGRFAV